MAYLQLQGIEKFFGENRAIKGIDLSIEKGEFIVFVGPSGCGKSTLLRLLAVLEHIDGGSLVLDGKDITQAPSSKRDLAMVFQSYALYPHMTVRENLAFGLKMRKTPAAEIETRVREAAEGARLAASFDLHGNLSAGIVEPLDVLVSYRTNPHLGPRAHGVPRVQPAHPRAAGPVPAGARVAQASIDGLAAALLAVHGADGAECPVVANLQVAAGKRHQLGIAALQGKWWISAEPDAAHPSTGAGARGFAGTRQKALPALGLAVAEFEEILRLKWLRLRSVLPKQGAKGSSPAA